MRFIDIHVGFPGRVHDARVFTNSPLFHDGITRCGDFVILGDSAYPNLDWLLTPFRENQQLTPNMRRYNRIHSSIRVTIERAFALLKGIIFLFKYSINFMQTDAHFKTHDNFSFNSSSFTIGHSEFNV